MRSSWAVLGAWGLLQATAHFVYEWTKVPLGDFFFLFPFQIGVVDSYEETTRHEWLAPFSFGVLGLVFMAIGLLLIWRRRAFAPPEAA